MHVHLLVPLLAVEHVNLRTKEVNVAVNICARRCGRIPDSIHAYSSCHVRPAHSPDDHTPFSLAPYLHCLGTLTLQCYIHTHTVPSSSSVYCSDLSILLSWSLLWTSASSLLCCCFPRFSRVEWHKGLLFVRGGKRGEFPEQAYTPNNIVLQHLRVRWTWQNMGGFFFLHYFYTTPCFEYTLILQTLCFYWKTCGKSHWNSNVSLTNVTILPHLFI